MAAEVVVVTATAAAVVETATAVTVVAVVVVEVPRQVAFSASLPPAALPQSPTKVGGLLVRLIATAAVLVGEAIVGLVVSVEVTETPLEATAATVQNPTHAYNAPPHSRIVTYSRNMS